MGRYEARTVTERTSELDELKQLTVKGTDYIYNCVTQPQAIGLSQGMYKEESKFTSDLVNSYAWDTAIVFLQTFDNRTNKTKPYSRQNSLNSSLANRGTNNLQEKENQDKICNIWDMASNTFEWTAEICSGLNDSFYGPCTGRGGTFNYNGNFTAIRFGHSATISGVYYNFRVLLYTI